MGLQSDKFTLQGNVQPWRCDLCEAAFEPDLKGICAGCGRIICPGHRISRENPRALGGTESVCPSCAGSQDGP